MRVENSAPHSRRYRIADNGLRIAAVSIYLTSIVAANWAIDTFGIVRIPGGLYAPAAVYVVGVTLILRDIVHEAIGRRGTLLVILVGAALSAAFSWQLALASGLAFLVSETLDLLVYEQVRLRFDSVLSGMLVSNAVSIPVDSIVFLWLAFGSLEFFWGQVVGKSIATVIAVGLLAAVGTAYGLLRERELV